MAPGNFALTAAAQASMPRVHKTVALGTVTVTTSLPAPTTTRSITVTLAALALTVSAPAPTLVLFATITLPVSPLNLAAAVPAHRIIALVVVSVGEQSYDTLLLQRERQRLSDPDLKAEPDPTGYMSRNWRSDGRIT